MRKKARVSPCGIGLMIAAGWLTGTSGAWAEGMSSEYDGRMEYPRPSQNAEGLRAAAAPVFRESIYGDRPHFGEPDSPGFGHPHYEEPSRRYGIWYRPRAFGLGVEERCEPSDFNPRGFGTLFNRPSTCYRMDYARYVSQRTSSRFGPSYYRREPAGACSCHYIGTAHGKTRGRCSTCSQAETRGKRRFLNLRK